MGTVPSLRSLAVSAAFARAAWADQTNAGRSVTMRLVVWGPIPKKRPCSGAGPVSTGQWDTRQLLDGLRLRTASNSPRTLPTPHQTHGSSRHIQS